MLEARALATHELAEGQRVSVELRIDAEQMQKFAELSGDFNPLHTDDAFAKAKGFEGRVVYGALLLARVSELIGMRLPGRDSIWAGLTVEFLRPLYVEQTAELEAQVMSHSESTGRVELRLTLRRAGKTLAKGVAEVIVVH